ncbi:gamma-glutamyltransferase family protein [Rhodovibrionaceae bacterium A322]
MAPGPDKGALACGHPETARAMAEILSDGGSAFDAILAGFAMACVAEPVLASLGGGGFLLARPADEAARFYDFFVDTPRQKRPVEEIDFFEVTANFGPDTQDFHVGNGAVATPGALAGLARVHQDLGSLPLQRLLEPAIGAARQGFRVGEMNGYIFSVVAPILTSSAAARALFTHDGKQDLLTANSLLRQEQLAGSLERLAEEGARPFYEGDWARELVQQSKENGGLLTAEDLSSYQVGLRAPLTLPYRSAEMITAPLPSTGGPLIAFALSLLAEGSALGTDKDSACRLAEAMALTNKARHSSGLSEAEGDEELAAAVAQLAAPELLQATLQELQKRPATARGTTHLSVIDCKGNAASLTLSNGEGSGVFVGDSGIHLNNMLGEEDLNPRGFNLWPCGVRLGSMMAPSLLQLSDGSEVALGSGGSNRIRSALLQVIVNLVDRGQSLDRAVGEPRLHVEQGKLHVEEPRDDSLMRALAAVPLLDSQKVWPEKNLFFGGAHCVQRTAQGQFSASGDVRRNGVAQIV